MSITTTKEVVTANGSPTIPATQAALGGPTRFTYDLRASGHVYDGGIITFSITNNGALGAQCTASLLIAHNTGTTPSAASAGSDWKTIIGPFGGGLTSGTVTSNSYTFGPEIQHLEVEFAGNTTNSVTVESYVSAYTIT